MLTTKLGKDSLHGKVALSYVCRMEQDIEAITYAREGRYATSNISQTRGDTVRIKHTVVGKCGRKNLGPKAAPRNDSERTETARRRGTSSPTNGCGGFSEEETVGLRRKPDCAFGFTKWGKDSIQSISGIHATSRVPLGRYDSGGLSLFLQREIRNRAVG
jgi:hypothetical protein